MLVDVDDDVVVGRVVDVVDVDRVVEVVLGRTVVEVVVVSSSAGFSVVEVVTTPGISRPDDVPVLLPACVVTGAGRTSR